MPADAARSPPRYPRRPKPPGIACRAGDARGSTRRPPFEEGPVARQPLAPSCHGPDDTRECSPCRGDGEGVDAVGRDRLGLDPAGAELTPSLRPDIRPRCSRSSRMCLATRANRHPQPAFAPLKNVHSQRRRTPAMRGRASLMTRRGCAGCSRHRRTAIGAAATGIHPRHWRRFCGAGCKIGGETRPAKGGQTAGWPDVAFRKLSFVCRRPLRRGNGHPLKIIQGGWEWRGGGGGLLMIRETAGNTPRRCPPPD